MICTMIDWPSLLQRPAYWPPELMQLISKQALQPNCGQSSFALPCHSHLS